MGTLISHLQFATLSFWCSCVFLASSWGVKMQRVQLGIQGYCLMADLALSKNHIYVSMINDNNTVMQFCRKSGSLVHAWPMRTRYSIRYVVVRHKHVFIANDHFVEMFREDGSFVQFICEFSSHYNFIHSLAVSDTNVFVTNFSGSLYIFELSGMLKWLVQKRRSWHKLIATNTELYVIGQTKEEKNAFVEVVSATDGTLLREFLLPDCDFRHVCVDPAGGLHSPKKNACTHWSPSGEKTETEGAEWSDGLNSVRRAVFDRHSDRVAVLHSDASGYLQVTFFPC